MSTPTPAVTQTDSAPVALPDLSTLSPEQRQTWRETGEMPKPQASAPAEKTDATAAPDSAPEKKDQKSTSDTAPESDTGTRQQPHRKTKEDTERRFQELLDRVKRAEERADAAERKASGSQPEKREQSSQPAPVKEDPKPPKALKEFLEDYFKSHKGAAYEEGVEAWQTARETYRDFEHQKKTAEAIAGERQRIAQEGASKEMQAKLQDATERYGKEEVEKIFPALGQVLNDQQIPVAIKAMLNESDVLVDLLYTLRSDSAEFTRFLELSKANPGAAIRQLVTTEALVRETLKSNAGKSAPVRGTDGKFQKTDTTTDAGKTTEAAQPITSAPRPPMDIGGRTSAPEDGAAAAVKANDFRAAKAAFNRDYAASHKL